MDPSFSESCGGVAPAQVAAFHHHAVEAVGQAGQFLAIALDHGHELDACGFQAFLVGGEVGTVQGGGIGELLEPLAGTGPTGAHGALDLALGGGLALGFAAGSHRLQAVVALDLAHEGFLAPVVLAVADHFAGVGDAVGEDVDVLVLGVGVAGDQVLAAGQAHAAQVAAADLDPLRIAQVFAGGGGKGDVQHGLAEGRAQPPDGAELGGELARGAPGHVGVEQVALAGLEIVFERAAKAAALDQFGDHSSAFTPRRASRRRRTSSMSWRTSSGGQACACPW